MESWRSQGRRLTTVRGGRRVRVCAGWDGREEEGEEEGGVVESESPDDDGKLSR